MNSWCTRSRATAPRAWSTATWTAACSERWKAQKMMFAAAALALLVTLALVVVRAALGPTVFDRVQAGNTIGTVALLLLSVLGFLTGRP